MHTLVIAEAGVNHNGDMNIARDLVDAAANAGADVVKFQTFTAEGLITKDVLSRKQELTKITASKEENLIQDENLSIFCQSLNTNIANVLDWTNNFPQIFLIPRPSRQVYDLVEMFNDEYISREEEVDFSNLQVPKGCEIMGYVI